MMEEGDSSVHSRTLWIYSPKDIAHITSYSSMHNFKKFREPGWRTTVLGHLPLFIDGEIKIQKGEMIFNNQG